MRKIGATFRNTCFFAFFVALLSSMMPADTRNSQRNAAEANCKNVRSQTSYSLSDMAGYWYGIEILEHLRSRPTVDSCIKVELQDRGNNRVNLIWKERNLDVTYKFAIEDSKHLGIWTSLGNQDVKDKPSGYDYEHFAGTVFVLKASDSNIVLTFCSSTKLFTLVMSKTHAINITELASIHNLVTRFGVQPAKDIKRYCKNHAYEAQPHHPLILSAIIVTFLSMYGKHT